MELDVINFIKENHNWKELLTADPYNLIVNEDADYFLIRYNQLNSDFTQQIVKECRGLIVSKKTLQPVALSFIKFFNVQEPNAAKILWNTAKVQEKVDGSKILVWYDTINSKWRVSTSGSLDAFKANVNDYGYTFGEVFIEALKNNDLGWSEEGGIYWIDTRDNNSIYWILDVVKCYTFELVSPKTRVVVPYKKSDIYFTGVRSMTTLDEIDKSTISWSKRFRMPKEYNIGSLKGCLEATERMGFDEEGFVVVDKYWNRVKIKSPAYVAAHYLRNNGVQSKNKILELLEIGEKDEFLSYYPEYTNMFLEIEQARNSMLNKISGALCDINEDLKADQKAFDEQKIIDGKIDRKKYAKKILENYKDISSFLFTFIDTDFIQYFTKTQWNKLTIDKKIEYIEQIIEENRGI